MDVDGVCIHQPCNEKARITLFHIVKLEKFMCSVHEIILPNLWALVQLLLLLPNFEIPKMQDGRAPR